VSQIACEAAEREKLGGGFHEKAPHKYLKG
jgi:hypothetical protein